MENLHGKAGGAVEKKRTEGFLSAWRKAFARSKRERPTSATPNRHRGGGIGGRFTYHLLRILLGASNSR